MTIVMIPALFLSLSQSERATGDSYVFPRDPAVIDVVRDLGAKGDGVTDDTDAIQRGLDMSSGFGRPKTGILYLPRGTYRITKTLVAKYAIGPFVAGESRDRTILRLDNGTVGLTSMLRTHPNDGGDTSADWFMRNFRNFTLDVGNNPEVDAIRWCSTNTGILKNLKIVGKGKIGINTGFIGQTGPNLIQDVTINGFETGIQSQWAWGQTLSRVTITNCRKVGLSVVANAVGAEDLTVLNTPLPISVDMPNDWYWWSGVLALVGGRLEGDNAAGPAIYNRASALYARNVRTKGYMRSIESNTPGGNVAAANVGEYLAFDTRAAFPNPITSSMNLPIKREPNVSWENRATNWLCLDDFGATAGDNTDDSPAIQAAIDRAARLRKTVVYFRGIGGGDPNWFTMRSKVRIHGSVRHVLALGFGRVLGENGGGFVVDDRSARTVKFMNLDSFGGPPITLENRSKSNQMVVESCGVSVVGNGRGDIFMTDCPSWVQMLKPGQSLWARHLNPEGDVPGGSVQNHGANIWALGVKSEGLGTKFRTTAGGKTEVLGMLMYGPGAPDNYPNPIFDVEDASTTVAALREISFSGNNYTHKAREKRGAEVKTLGTWPGEHYWIGWSLLSARVK